MKYLVLFLTSIILISCHSKRKADLIVYNAVVYTVDSTNTSVQAFAVKDGKFLATGTDKEILDKFESKEQLNADGKTIFPGFIDAHCHFYSYGLGLQRADLVGTVSFQDVLEKVKAFASISKAEWIIGRGWDQNDWENKNFPDKTELDKLFPNRPVYLTRIDGHAALANSEALKRAGITAKTKIDGGIIELSPDKKKMTGILIDNALELVKNIIPKPNNQQRDEALLSAQKNCFAVGLTTVDDAGLNMDIFERIAELQKSGKLLLRIYGMLGGNKDNIDKLSKQGIIKTDKLNIRSFKFYADGALGSRGACLLAPYSDKMGHFGMLLNKPDSFDYYANILYQKGFQMCTHCIGDSANRFILNVYAKYLKGQNNLRWRIEHAQVVAAADISKFKTFSIIPSIQATHATSDMYWAGERLGKDRIKTAYAYKDLLNQNGMIAGGSDFPVEDINPLYGFYAAISRQDAKGFPKGGFQMENALTREEALRSMTIWAAYSNFEEKEKGSIESGKFADFVILDKDIMKCSLLEARNAKVLKTFLDGKRVH